MIYIKLLTFLYISFFSFVIPNYLVIYKIKVRNIYFILFS